MSKGIASKIALSCLLGLTLVSAPVFADNALAECSKELLLAYFPEAFVNEALKKFNVPESEWAGINEELAAKDKDVISIVEDKASKIDPNPLKDPQQRQAAVKIFRETLFEVFSGVMKKHGVTDDKQIQAMLDEVQLHKANRFKECMEKQRSEMKKNAAEASSETTPQTGNQSK